MSRQSLARNRVLQVVFRLDILADNLGAWVLVFKVWIWYWIVVLRYSLAVDDDADTQAQALYDSHVADQELELSRFAVAGRDSHRR